MLTAEIPNVRNKSISPHAARFVKYTYKHCHLFTEHKKCKCGASKWAVAKMICASGQVKYPWYCRMCGRASNVYEPKHDHLVYAAVINDSTDNQCEKCGKMGAELHHWAPRHLFGDQADRWPVSFLCQECHATWHQAVTPDMGQH